MKAIYKKNNLTHNITKTQHYLKKLINENVQIKAMQYYKD